MIHKFKTRCRKITHETQRNMMTIMREAEKYFSEGFRMGRYGKAAGAWHLSSEDMEHGSRTLLNAMEWVAMHKRCSEEEAAKIVMLEVTRAGCRCGIDQYNKEEKKDLWSSEESAECDRRFTLAEQAFETYWNDKTYDIKEE